MNPTPKSAHVDSALSDIAIGYNNPMFIADRVFPHVPVTKKSDYFFKFLKGDWFRLEAGLRGAGAEAPKSGYKLGTDTYSCLEYALAHPIPIELINNADVAVRPWLTGVNYVMRHVLLRKEYVVSKKIVTASNWTTSNDAEGGWLYSGTSTFMADMFAAKKTIRELIGVDPNVFVCDANTWDSICQTDEVLERITGGGTVDNPAVVTKALVAALFGLDEVLVGGAIYSSDEETVAGTEFTAVRMWETNANKGSAWLGYRTPTPAIAEPNAGYIFEFMGDEGQQDAIEFYDIHREVRKWWDSPKKSWMVEASEHFDAKVTSADAGYLFYDTLAT